MKKILLYLCLLLPSFAFANPLLDKFNQEMPTVVSPFTDNFHHKTKEQIEEQNLSSSQYIVVVDRNKDNQVLSIVYFDREKGTAEFSNFAAISTGDNRRGHFTTPTGWFENLVENGSYRAEGTKNSNGVRGYGRKGMRVWDMGWQEAQAGWKTQEDMRQIRFQMHATDPDSLQKKLGTRQSQGCVRVHELVNNFIDKYGLIDKHFEEISYWALRKDREPVPNAGSFVLVIDTSE